MGKESIQGFELWVFGYLGIGDELFLISLLYLSFLSRNSDG